MVLRFGRTQGFGQKDLSADMILSGSFSIPRLSLLPVRRTEKTHSTAIAHPGLRIGVFFYGGLSQPEMRGRQNGISLYPRCQQTAKDYFALKVSALGGFLQFRNAHYGVDRNHFTLDVQVSDGECRR